MSGGSGWERGPIRGASGRDPQRCVRWLGQRMDGAGGMGLEASCDIGTSSAVCGKEVVKIWTLLWANGCFIWATRQGKDARFDAKRISRRDRSICRA